MNYQELVDKCKNAYKDHNLLLAYTYWKKIHEILDNKLDKYDESDQENRYKCYAEFDKYMDQFASQEIYDITDYGKEKYYIEKGYLDL